LKPSDRVSRLRACISVLATVNSRTTVVVEILCTGENN